MNFKQEPCYKHGLLLLRRKQMIRIKQQTVNSEDICEKVLADVFGEGY